MADAALKDVRLPTPTPASTDAYTDATDLISAWVWQAPFECQH